MGQEEHTSRTGNGPDGAGQGGAWDSTDTGPGRRIPQRRLLIALGNAERENALLPRLEEVEEFTTEVYMHAHDVRARLHDEDARTREASGAIDAVLLSGELPGFGRELLVDLARHQLSIHTIVLTGDLNEATEGWSSLDLAAVLPLDADVGQVQEALVAASRRSRSRGRAASLPAAAEGARATGGVEPSREPVEPLAVIAVVSGAGSPGRSTVAGGLTAGLGAWGSAIYVDADLAGPSAAALLGVEPRRNIFQVAFERRTMAQDWDAGFARNVQPIDPRSPGGRVICGMTTRRMAAEVSADFFAQLLEELRARFRHVVVDLGSDLTGSDKELHRVGLDQADQVLLVATPDPLGLSRAQVALSELVGPRLGVAPERIAIVVNRHDRRTHHRRVEIEYALGIPLAAIIPYDYHGVERAKHDQRPIVVYRSSAAGRSLLKLASRVVDGRIVLPPEPGRSWRERLATVKGLFGRERREDGADVGATGMEGGPDRAGTALELQAEGVLERD